MIRERAKKAAIKTLQSEAARYLETLEKEGETTIDLLNTGIRFNVTAAKKKGLKMLLETLKLHS